MKYNYKNINEKIDVMSLYRYLVGTKQEDIITNEIKIKLKSDYFELMNKIENMKPFASNLCEMRTDYQFKKRFGSEYEEQINRTFDPNYNKINFEHAIQRNITANKDDFKEILGEIVYYEFPLFYKSNNKDINTGKIDLIAYNQKNNTLYLYELKKTDGGKLDKENYFKKSSETFMRAYAEITTYYTFFKELYELKQAAFMVFLKNIIENFTEEKYNKLIIKKGLIGPKSLFESKYIAKVNDCDFYIIETKVDTLKNKKVKDKGLFEINKYE